MRTLVVGDIHGKASAVEQALAADVDHVVFLGDYLDSFTNSVEDHIKCLRLVLQAQREGKATALRGNHEMSYMGLICGGYNHETASIIKNDPDLDLEELVPYHWEQGFLLTHAGVSNRMLKHRKQTVDEYLEKGAFTQIGAYRGGRDPYGGLYWCDWRHDFDPVPGVPQIVGHTHATGIRMKGLSDKDGDEYSYCIDCLPYETRSEGYSPDNCIILEDGKTFFYRLWDGITIPFKREENDL